MLSIRKACQQPCALPGPAASGENRSQPQPHLVIPRPTLLLPLHVIATPSPLTSFRTALAPEESQAPSNHHAPHDHPLSVIPTERSDEESQAPGDQNVRAWPAPSPGTGNARHPKPWPQPALETPRPRLGGRGVTWRREGGHWRDLGARGGLGMTWGRRPRRLAIPLRPWFIDAMRHRLNVFRRAWVAPYVFIEAIRLPPGATQLDRSAYPLYHGQR